MEKIQIRFYSGYNGAVKCTATIDNQEHIIELDELTADLEKQIKTKGYTINQTNRQKYPRLTINK